MAKTSIVHARLDPELKSNVESILSQIGITPSDAVNLLFKQIELVGGLPFELKIPHYTHDTITAIEQARQLSTCKNATTYTSIEELKRAIEQ